MVGITDSDLDLSFGTENVPAYLQRRQKCSIRQLQHKDIVRNRSDTVASRKGQNMWIPSYSEGYILMKKPFTCKVLGKEGLSLS